MQISLDFQLLLSFPSLVIYWNLYRSMICRLVTKGSPCVFMVNLWSFCLPPWSLYSLIFFPSCLLWWLKQYCSYIDWIQCELALYSSMWYLGCIAYISGCSFDIIFSWSCSLMVWHEWDILYSCITLVISNKFPILIC